MPPNSLGGVQKRMHLIFLSIINSCLTFLFQASLKDDYISALDGRFKSLSKFLGDRPFFAGEHVTHPDFHVYEMLYSHQVWKVFGDPA